MKKVTGLFLFSLLSFTTAFAIVGCTKPNASNTPAGNKATNGPATNAPATNAPAK